MLTKFKIDNIFEQNFVYGIVEFYTLSLKTNKKMEEIFSLIQKYLKLKFDAK